MVHILKGMLLSHQKVGNNAIYSNIEGTNHDYIRESKSERGRQIYEITDKLVLKSDTNSFLKEIQNLRLWKGTWFYKRGHTVKKD